MQNADTIDINIRYEQYQINSCNYGVWTKFNNLPTDVNKKWTFTKTKEALTILCNGVEVVNLVYAEQYHYCTTRWSKDVTRIRFHNADTASDYWKSVTQGKIFCLRLLLKYLSTTVPDKTIQTFILLPSKIHNRPIKRLK